jgi:hypothetical protein
LLYYACGKKRLPFAYWLVLNLTQPKYDYSNCQEGYLMELSSKKVTNFMLAVEGIGVVFAGIFLAAYLAGLPFSLLPGSKPIVFHSELGFRIPLAVFGLMLVFLALASLVVAALRKD